MPDAPISFAEMQAINIFTGAEYAKINGLMRDDRSKFNYRIVSLAIIRSTLLHSVFCASGLTKLPETHYTQSYRGASLGTEQELQERIKAAAEQGVINLDGFVSTSVSEESSFTAKAIHFVFKNLRGAYIAPISQNAHEEEFLIPQTQVQILDFNMLQGHPVFNVSQVAELGIVQRKSFSPYFLADKAPESVLSYADPQVVLELLYSEQVSPSKLWPPILSMQRLPLLPHYYKGAKILLLKK